MPNPGDAIPAAALPSFYSRGWVGGISTPASRWLLLMWKIKRNFSDSFLVKTLEKIRTNILTFLSFLYIVCIQEFIYNLTSVVIWVVYIKKWDWTEKLIYLQSKWRLFSCWELQLFFFFEGIQLQWRN